MVSPRGRAPARGSESGPSGDGPAVGRARTVCGTWAGPYRTSGGGLGAQGRDGFVDEGPVALCVDLALDDLTGDREHESSDPRGDLVKRPLAREGDLGVGTPDQPPVFLLSSSLAVSADLVGGPVGLGRYLPCL